MSTPTLNYAPRQQLNISLFKRLMILAGIISLPVAVCVCWPQYSDIGERLPTSDTSTLQDLRARIELFKIQHGNHPPAQAALAAALLNKTSPDDIEHPDSKGTLGPYLQTFPTNPINGKSAIGLVPSPTVGWVYTADGTNFELRAVDKSGKLLTY